MKTRSKRILLIVFITILIVVNISALTTIFYNNRIKVRNTNQTENFRDEVRIRGMHSFLKEELNLTDKQFESFKKVNQSNMIKTHTIATELNEKRHEMMNELAKLNPNQRKLDKIAREVGDLHYELKKQTITHFLELKEICSPDQQEKLQQMFLKMVDNDDNLRMKRRSHDRGRNRHMNGSGKNKGN